MKLKLERNENEILYLIPLKIVYTRTKFQPFFRHLPLFSFTLLLFGEILLKTTNFEAINVF